MAEHYLGLMSGTSVDAVDAVLMDLSGPARVVAQSRCEFPPELRRAIWALFDSGPDEIERAAAVDNGLARLYARAAKAALAAAELQPEAVSAIGCHGQTVRHRPDAPEPFTLQLGNPSLLAELTGITVVADFRRRDLAAGGQGAPLAPAFHQAFFASPSEPVAVVNLGGMANLSLLVPGEEPWGFDSGPGNVLLNLVAAHWRLGPHDEGGRSAAKGQIQPSLLSRFLDEEFFGRSPPKSTGRERFNRGWLEARAGALARWRPEDLLATLVELTGQTVTDALSSTRVAARELLVCGGGARNDYLLSRLRQLSGLVVVSTEHRGLEPELVEAAGFAWLARQHLQGLPGNCPRTTGARGPRVLGGSYPA